MVLLIDNYDSFTYNIYQILIKMDLEVKVVRNDKITIPEVRELDPSHIIISPGPGRPEDAGISVDLVKEFKGNIPILGICLGHQVIGAAFGVNVTYAREICHGKESMISHDGNDIFQQLNNPLKVIRYHSLVLEKKSIPKELKVTAISEDGTIMGINHNRYSITGIQFHPESIGTEQGEKIIHNFVTEEHRETFIKKSLCRVLTGKNLSKKEAMQVMDEVTQGKATPAQISSLLTALSIKGESVSEIAGFATVLRERALKVEKPKGVKIIDTCGTGGDLSGTFNISTTSAFVTAAAGSIVAKHGNRSITSRCGSADLLEALGVSITSSIEQTENALRKVGIGFLFAPSLHPSMKYAGVVRREIGIRTVFNTLGPLANPADADSQLIGVYSEDLTEKIARVLVELGTKRAMVVYGMDGLDEITLTRETKISEVRDGWINSYYVTPQDFGLICCSPEDLKGGDLRTNAEITLDILSGKKGPQRDIVLFNAGASIYLDGKAKSFKEGVELAGSAIDSGKAMEKLDQLIRVSNEC